MRRVLLRSRKSYGHAGYPGHYENWPVRAFYGSFGYPGNIEVRAVLAGHRLFVMEVREHNGRPTPEVKEAFLNSLQIVDPVLPTPAPAPAE